MSTRSTITVREAKDGTEAYSIYRHMDGYPDSDGGVLKTLEQALPFAWRLPRYEAMDFAAAIVAAWKERGGGNIYLTPGRDSHGDTEWHYEIYPAKAGEFFGEPTSNHICVDVYEATHGADWNKPPTWKKHGRTHRLTADMHAAA